MPAMAATEPTKTEPKPEPAKTESEPAKTEPVAKTESEPAVMKQPTIDNATVSSVVGTHRPEVLKCFAEGKKKDHGLKGTVALQMQVDAGGKVHHIQVQSTLKDPLVAACVVKSANNWKFPTRSGNGELATVSYPFTIN
jgi:outer membrane biosynthesis protein TonB